MKSKQSGHLEEFRLNRAPMRVACADMRWTNLSFLFLAALLAGCGALNKNPAPAGADRLTAFQASAAKFNSIITLPVFEIGRAHV